MIAATTAGGRVHREVEQVMGLPVSVALRGRDAGADAGRTAWLAVLAELRQVDRMFSPYREESYVSRLARGELLLSQCPLEVAEVLALGEQAEAESDGAFSVRLPGPDGRRCLDPSGVVKGWATQRASRFLAALEDTDFCLSAGGDMVCVVTDPQRPAWRIGVEHPLEPQRLVAVIPVRSAAVATSGASHRGAHLVDARTGTPARGVASVTVIGTDLTWADIDATAAYAQGPAGADWLRTRAARSALVVWPDGTTTTIDGRPSGPSR